MDNQTLQKLRDAITKSNAIGIAVAPNPNLDQMAAALSLAMLLKEANKTAAVASPTDPIVEISNLVGINKVQKTLGGGSGSAGDLIVSFPYLEGEIEKVSYTLENGFLNITLRFKKDTSAGTTLIPYVNQNFLHAPPSSFSRQ